MKKINFKDIIIGSIIILLPIILGIIFYNDLPSRIGIHFDANSNADTYVPKAFALFIIPILLTLLNAFICIKNDLNSKSHNKLECLTKSIIPVLSIVVYIIMLLKALDKNIDTTMIAYVMTGIIFIIIGNYLPKTDVNDYKGINLTALIKDEKKYNILKKVLGYTLIISGSIIIGAIFFNSINSLIIVSTVLIVTTVEVLYFKIK